MATKRTVEFYFKSNASSLKTQFDSIGKKVKDVNVDFKKISTNLSSAGKSMTKSFTLPIVAGLGLATKNASDLNEAVSATDFIFKTASTKVKEFGKTAAKELGISNRAALDAVATFGAMGTSMGQTEDSAADMGIELIKRAADLTSLRNLQKGVAETALKGIYTGETESLKGLGVVMTQSNLALFAMKNNMLKTGDNTVKLEKAQIKVETATKKYNKALKEHGKKSLTTRKALNELKLAQEGVTKAGEGSLDNLTQQEKVALRYKFVMEATAGAQGNFAETSGDMANASRIAMASFEDAGASLGELLLPMLTKLVNKITKVITWFGGLDEKQKKTIITILGIVAAMGPLLIVIGSLIKIVMGLVTAFNFLAANPIIIAILLIVGAIFLIIAAVKMLAKHWDTVTEVIRGGVEFWLYKINGFINKIRDKFNSFKNNLVSGWKIIGSVITGAVKGAINGVVWTLNKGIGFINLFLKGINAVIRAMNKVPGVNLPTAGMIKKLPSLAIGTNEVQSDGLANIHKGEAIVPADVVKGGFSGNYGVNSNVASNSSNMINVKIEQTPIVIQMNDKELVNAILPEFSRKIRTGGGGV